MHELGPAAPRVPRASPAPRPRESSRRRRPSVPDRVPRKPKIACFWSPTHTLRLAISREAQEDRELQRARVLELVDEHEVDLAGEARVDVGTIEKPEREHLLIGEVDARPVALVVLVGVERARRDREDQRDGVAEIGLQLRVPVVGGGRGAERRRRSAGTLFATLLGGPRCEANPPTAAPSRRRALARVPTAPSRALPPSCWSCPSRGRRRRGAARPPS